MYFFKYFIATLSGLFVLLSFICLGAVVEATELNITNSIDVTVSELEDSGELALEYTITQAFRSPSRGIFIALPKNQDGVRVDYSLVGVQVTDPEFETYTPVYNEILELDEYRLRIGEEDVFLDFGTYVYEFTVLVDAPTEYKYNQVILEDWLNETELVRVEYQGDNICENQYCNPTGSITIERNSDKDYFPWWKNVLIISAPYALVILAISAIGMAVYYRVSRDMQHSTIDSPNFDHPDIYPWEADFIRRDGVPPVKLTLLAYLLHLEQNKYIALTLNKKQFEIKKLKRLPKILPQEFNTIVTSISMHGMVRGLKKTKISETMLYTALDKSVIESTKEYYEQQKIPASKLTGLIVFPLFLIIPLLVFPSILRSLLIGNSFDGFIYLAFVVCYVWYVFIIIRWARVNIKGFELRQEIKQYYYYLNYAEKEKLNFSNNEEEVQFYLDQLPYAANFGLLEKFTQFMATKFPNQELSTNYSTMGSMISTTSFYIPPSTSSSSGFSSSSGGFSGGGGSW